MWRRSLAALPVGVLELVGWVEPLRNPSHAAIASMGFASTLRRVKLRRTRSLNSSYKLFFVTTSAV
jgi:hypothetical protein